MGQMGMVMDDGQRRDLIDRARRERNAGMELVARGANPNFITFARHRVLGMLLENEYFHTDDFHVDYPADAPPTRDLRALGPVINGIARQGYMVNTGTFKRSVKSKMGPKPIWKSKIFGGS